MSENRWPTCRRMGQLGLCLCGLLLLGRYSGLAAAEPAFDTGRYQPWTTSRIVGSPDPPDPYRLTVAFPKLTFQLPIDLVAVPGTQRLAVVEQKQGISTFTVARNVARAERLLDTSKLGDVLAVAFHPKFRQNGEVYFTYSAGGNVHLARVRCKQTGGAAQADPASRKVIYSWPSGGHNGGCVRFGTDGYLYLATGDGSGHSDTNQYAQNVSDPRGSILRLDVDRTNGDKPYAIPADNPFVDRPQTLPEIFAYGLRQPWKMSFDSQGRLWAGDVGQDLWEMVHVIRKGANYGWSLTEGSHPFRPERKQGPTPIVPPIVEHNHTEFRSVTGGHVYQASRLPELKGAYIYGDFDTGRIWMLRYDGRRVADHQALVASQARVVGFGRDHAGEVYVVDYASGRISRLEKNPLATDDHPPFPTKLSETGLFQSTRDHRVAAGVIPYSINAPAFADGAVVERYLALPAGAKIELDALLYPRGPFAAPGWRFPDGSVLVQTFAMPRSDGQQLRRIETRILHHQRMPGNDDNYGAQIWHGYTYVWNDEGTDAELAPRHGTRRVLRINDPETGRQRQQTWRIPSRNGCTVCHNIAAKHVIGMNTMQMNRRHRYADREDNQLSVFARLKLFAKPLPKTVDQLPRMADYHDVSTAVDKRARSYLHANCSHCHRQWGGGNSSFQLMATMPLDKMQIVGAKPAHGSFGIGDARVVAPGSPYQSALLYRVLSVGSARMPRRGATTVDVFGARLLHDWIAGLPAKNPARVDEQLPASLLAGQPKKPSAADVDAWLATTPRAVRLIHAIDSGKVGAAAQRMIVERAAVSGDSQLRDLFDRYLPESRRLKRLGDDIDPRAILAMTGDAGRGRTLFFESKTLQCKKCHQVHGKGTAVGPDLSRLGGMQQRGQILDSILNPSKQIKPEYRVFVVETADGRVLSGLRLPDTGDDVVLKDAANKSTRLKADDVETIQPQPKSLMPDAQVRSLTAQQLADLVEYLHSLK